MVSEQRTRKVVKELAAAGFEPIRSKGSHTVWAKGAVKNYEVTISREGKWWMISIPELGGLTQAKTVKQAHEAAREYIAVSLDVPADSFGLHVSAERVGRVEHVTQYLEDVRMQREQASALEREATARMKALAAGLAAENLPLREIAAVMEISHQRVDQLLKS